MKKFLSHILVFVAIFSFGFGIIHADGGPTGVATTIPNPFNCGGSNTTGNTGCNLTTFLNTIVSTVVLPVGGVLAVLAFIWVGFMYVLARGNPAKIGTANNALLYVAIGTAVLLGASLISAVVSNTLGQLKS